MEELTRGAVLGGYRFEALVDRGPDVDVWRARGADGACLVLALRFLPERTALDRLAPRLLTLRLAGVPAYLDWDRAGERVFFFSEAGGTPLARALPASFAARLDLLDCVAAALDRLAAAGLAHGGLRPGHVLLDGDGAPWLAAAGLTLLKPAARPSARLDIRALAELAQGVLTARSGNASRSALASGTARVLAAALAPEGRPPFARATDLARALRPVPPLPAFRPGSIFTDRGVGETSGPGGRLARYSDNLGGAKVFGHTARLGPRASRPPDAGAPARSAAAGQLRDTPASGGRDARGPSRAPSPFPANHFLSPPNSQTGSAARPNRTLLGLFAVLTPFAALLLVGLALLSAGMAEPAPARALVAAPIAPVSAPPASDEGTEVRARLDRAAPEDWPRQIELLRPYVASHPEDGEARERLRTVYVRYGVELQFRDRYLAATELYREALDVFPESPVLKIGLAASQKATGSQGEPVWTN
jgi:hypothetical protein